MSMRTQYNLYYFALIVSRGTMYQYVYSQYFIIADGDENNSTKSEDEAMGASPSAHSQPLTVLKIGLGVGVSVGVPVLVILSVILGYLSSGPEPQEQGDTVWRTVRIRTSPASILSGIQSLNSGCSKSIGNRSYPLDRHLLSLVKVITYRGTLRKSHNTVLS